MKIGVVIPSRIENPHRALAWESAREHSEPDTDVTVVFNGCDPVAVPSGVMTIHRGDPYTDEADLWWDALQLAERSGWEWCMMMHDDFRMMEPGWEAQLRESAGWRVAIAAHCVFSAWAVAGGCFPSWVPADNAVQWPSRLGVTIDSMTFAFRPDVFRARGCVTDMRVGFGFGAWDACAWALMNDYGCWRINQDSWHHWIPNQNTRALVHAGAGGHPEFGQRYGGHVYGCEVTQDGASIQLPGGRTFRCAPDGWIA